ncbi:MAG TPA: enolase C-terminal domain-like protein [Flavisolibacter sp.]|nr:enolase C-terminal domain-like protein [Flavisolibacter sp.]
MLTERVVIEEVQVSAYLIPTDAPEADGTINWSSTTLVLVELTAGGQVVICYTYGNAVIAEFIYKDLKKLIQGADALHNNRITNDLIRHIRNEGTCGIAMMAVSAVDNALWDLKAKIFETPLCLLLGSVIDGMEVYGSGGFTSYTSQQLEQQLSGWADEGIKSVKMKIGTHPEKDPDRVKQARKAIGESNALFVDANGAYSVKQAIHMAEEFNEYGVSWFEEPVPSDDLNGLCFIRNHVPGNIRITAGEYGYHGPYFESMLRAGAVDVFQADATRCGGITGFLKAGILSEGHQVHFSSHCAPSIHLHAAITLNNFYIAEYFHDHVRIEKMLFDGICQPQDGIMYPDLSRPGLGIAFRQKDAEKYKI